MRRRWNTISPIGIDVTVTSWFICLSRSCIVHKQQKISTRFLLHTTTPRLSQIALKFGLHRPPLPPPNFAQKWQTPVDLNVGDIRRQLAAEWLQIAQWSQWRAYRKPPSLFGMVPSLTPYNLPFPQNWGPKCTPGPTSRRMLPPGEYDRRYRLLGSCVGYHYEQSVVAFCQLTLVIVSIARPPSINCYADLSET